MKTRVPKYIRKNDRVYKVVKLYKNGDVKLTGEFVPYFITKWSNVEKYGYEKLYRKPSERKRKSEKQSAHHNIQRIEVSSVESKSR